ncbi:MAG: BMC domain-containing protein [Clostridium sp.]|nr:BMC domain-containing protein [Clostridium sp.]
MNEALGLVETRGITNAIFTADVMVKTANVHIIEIENTRGSGYITVKIAGDVGAVNAAVSAGKNAAIQYNSLISAKVIPRPSIGVQKTFCSSNENKKPEPINVNDKKENIKSDEEKINKSDVKEEKVNVNNEQPEKKSEIVEEKKVLKEEVEDKKEEKVLKEDKTVKEDKALKEENKAESKTEPKKPKKTTRKVTRKKSETTKKNEPNK